MASSTTTPPQPCQRTRKANQWKKSHHNGLEDFFFASDEDTDDTDDDDDVENNNEGDIAFDSALFLNLFDTARNKPMHSEPPGRAQVNQEYSAKVNQHEADLEESNMAELAILMDEELRGTKVTEGFEREPTEKNDVDDGDDPEAGSVDLDMNLITNLLRSYSSQAGMAGPVSNIFGTLNMPIPKDFTSDTL